MSQESQDESPLNTRFIIKGLFINNRVNKSFNDAFFRSVINKPILSEQVVKLSLGGIYP